MRKALCLLFLLMLCAAGARAEMPELRGYDSSASQKYIYVTFGTYFSDGYGTISPVLWRVLGPGIPGEDDVSTDGINENDNSIKSANEDVITPENQDVYCLMTEYIIDFHLYNEVRDTRDGEPLAYEDSELYRFINETSLELDENGKPIGMLGWLFTEDERSVLMDMPGRGLISPPSRKGELFRIDYGFINEDFRECLRRQATGTRYAFDQGLKYIVDSWSWYWTTDRRRVGFRWIVGDNGHTSVAGADREGGIRLVCYPHTDLLTCIGGSGTLDDPYQLITKAAYVNAAKTQAVGSAKALLAAQRESAAYSLSRSQVAAQTQAVAQANAHARALAEAEAERAAAIANAQTAKRAALSRMAQMKRYAAQQSESARQAVLQNAAAGSDPLTPAFEASPSGVVFFTEP